jgi:hypothetical protein
MRGMGLQVRRNQAAGAAGDEGGAVGPGPRARRERTPRRRQSWRLVLLFVALITLFLSIAGAAFASAIVVDEGKWFIYSHSQLGSYYMKAPIVTDMAAGTPGAQVAILSPEKRPIWASHTWYNERTNTSYEFMYGFDHELTISPYPQLTTLDGTGLLSRDQVGLEVLDTYSDPYAKAAQLYDGGTWKLY